MSNIDTDIDTDTESFTSSFSSFSSSSSSSSKICSLCLGSDTDIPPFGTIDDAKDLISPCSTCSIITHRKCLLDWFNSVPADKLHIIRAHRQSTSRRPISRNNNNNNNNNNNGSLNESNINHEENFDDLGVRITPTTGMDQNTTATTATTTTRIEINLSTQALLNWLSTMTAAGANTNEIEINNHHHNNNNNNSDNNTDVTIPGGFPISRRASSSSLSNVSSPPHHGSSPNHDFKPSNEYLVYILAPCPQCKRDIIFSMSRSPILALHSSMKTIISRMVQYGGVFVGITSALTGLLSMGYIGLTTCGLKMMDCIIPSPILIRILTKKSSLHTHSSYQTLSKILFGNTNSGGGGGGDDASSYVVDNLEQGLIQGLIDPFKFSRIPVLPIVMYRARSSSILNCFIGKEQDNKVNSLLTETMLLSYISSIGDHKLLKSLIKNISHQILNVIKTPSNILNIFNWKNLFKDINWYDSRNIISLIIPMRWIYDIFIYRLIFNRQYFNLIMKIRPRSIANSLTSKEIDNLEDLNNQLNDLKKLHHKINTTIMKKIDKKFSKFIKTNSNSYFGTTTTTNSWLVKLISPIIKYLYGKVLYLQKINSTSGWFKYLKLKILIQWKYTIACFKNDYSQTLSSNNNTNTNTITNSFQNIIIKSLTTLIWPFLSSKLNELFIYPIFLLNNPKSWLANNNNNNINNTLNIGVFGLSMEKKILIGNLLGLIMISIIKELINLYLTKLKVYQMSKIETLNSQDSQILKDVTSTIFHPENISISTNNNNNNNNNADNDIFPDLDNITTTGDDNDDEDELDLVTDDSDESFTMHRLVELGLIDESDFNIPGGFNF